MSVGALSRAVLVALFYHMSWDFRDSSRPRVERAPAWPVSTRHLIGALSHWMCDHEYPPLLGFLEKAVGGVRRPVVG